MIVLIMIVEKFKTDIIIVLMSSVNKVGIMHRGWASINRSVETGLSVVF
jgi:hypothetical protein